MNEIVDGRMADGGAMKYAAITPEVFADYRLHRGDVLFNRTNSIEHVGKTGLFDLEGDYCFASYLIRIVPDRAKVLPLFLTRMMVNAAEWQAEAKSKAAKAINQANINAGVMKALRVPVPPLKEQERFVQAVVALESQIATARALLRTAPARKEADLERAPLAHPAPLRGAGLVGWVPVVFAALDHRLISVVPPGRPTVHSEAPHRHIPTWAVPPTEAVNGGGSESRSHGKVVRGIAARSAGVVDLGINGLELRAGENPVRCAVRRASR